MTGTSKKPEVSDRVEADHKHLKQEMEQLQAISRGQVSAEGFADWRLDLSWRLGEFQSRLLKHFDLEEEGGFMHDVLTLAPNAERQVEELRREHGEMEAGLNRVVAAIKDLKQGMTQELEGLRRDLADLAQTLLKHESEEHHLLQRTYYRDIGALD